MRTRRGLRLITVICVACLCGNATRSSGQEGEQRTSVGAYAAGFGLNDDSGLPKTSGGVGGWVTVPVPGRVALEVTATYFPGDEAVEFESQGGPTLRLGAGARGTFLDGRHLRLDGLLRAGIIRFANTASGFSDGRVVHGPKTRLALDIGLGIELLPRARWSPRIDLLQVLYDVPGAVVTPPSGAGTAPFATSLARIADTFQISAGLAYKFGAPRLTSARSLASGRRWTVGPLLGFSSGAAGGDLALLHNGGVGAFASYRVVEYLHLDGAFTSFFHEPTVRTPWEGGHPLQLLGGAKIGVTRDRIGVFAKLRGGAVSYGEAFESRDVTGTRTYARSNLGALDIGGIVEIDTSSRLQLRMEAGDVMLFYGRRTIMIDGAPVEQGSERARQSIQFSLGAGWRF